MSSLASLPWYDFPEIATATEALWHGVRRHLVRLGVSGVPHRLDRSLTPQQQWASPGLLLTQACGYDAVLSSRHLLQVVATPRFDLPGCQGSNYSSLVVVRQDSSFRSLADLRGARCAINSPTSHSGMNSLRTLVAGLCRQGRFFSELLTSGGHRASLDLVRAGRADVAAIDCISYAILKRHRRLALEGLRVLTRTRPVPAPPYVTRRSAEPRLLQRLRQALQATFADSDLENARSVLMLGGVDFRPLKDYGVIADQERQAAQVATDLWPTTRQVGGRRLRTPATQWMAISKDSRRRPAGRSMRWCSRLLSAGGRPSREASVLH